MTHNDKIVAITKEIIAIAKDGDTIAISTSTKAIESPFSDADVHHYDIIVAQVFDKLIEIDPSCDIDNVDIKVFKPKSNDEIIPEYEILN
jgi:hypothetical protein